MGSTIYACRGYPEALRPLALAVDPKNMTDTDWEVELMNRATRMELEAAWRRRAQADAAHDRKIARIFAAAGMVWLIMLAAAITWRVS